MSRPAQLIQQMERVKELQAEMLEGDKPTDPVTPAAHTPTEPVTPVVIESPASVSKEEYNKLEQRYRTLQGMHQADVSRLRNELMTAQAAAQSLEDRLVAVEKSTQTSSAPAKYITEKDQEEYGDTLEVFRRAAREEAEAIFLPREQKYLERIAQLETKQGHIQNTVLPTVENITRTQQQTVSDNFYAAIAARVPDWEAINDTPAFKAWCLAADPVTGGTKQLFLDQAAAQWDAPRVIRFFEEWKRTQAGGQTPAPNKNAQTDLEKMVAPGASKGGNQAAPDKKQWTNADIAQFYRDITTGKYAGKLEERKKIEADIYAAQAEGRISS